MITLKKILSAAINSHQNEILKLYAAYVYCNEKDLKELTAALYFALDLIDIIERFEEDEKENRKI